MSQMLCIWQEFVHLLRNLNLIGKETCPADFNLNLIWKKKRLVIRHHMCCVFVQASQYQYFL